MNNLFEYFFGEDQGRYVLEIDVNKLENVKQILKENNIYYENIGFTQRDNFEIEDELKINIKDLFQINNKWKNKF